MSAFQPSPAQVAIVSADGKADAGLAHFLREQGVSITRIEAIDTCVNEIRRGTVLVIFADDFRFDQVVGVLFALRRERPDVHVALVTKEPARFANVIPPGENALTPSIIKQPAHAWKILETIRARA